MKQVNENSASILVVDDVSKNIQLVANHLKEEGYNIYFATNGVDALELAAKQTLNLILLDIMMPGMDGFEVCSQLQAHPRTKEVPIVFLTAKTDISSITRGFELGGVDYITKPFNKMELLARVRTHVALNSQKRELKELIATKDKFFSLIAHDLKNPFNHLLGLSDIILKSAENFRKEEVLLMAQMMQSSAKKGSELLANLLEWSRSQTGSLKFAPEKLDLFNQIKDTIELTRASAEAKQIKLLNNTNPGLYVFADVNIVNTILRNLITNAIKFTYNEGRVIISAETGEQYIHCSVTDTGIGMNSEMVRNLFEIGTSSVRMGTEDEKGTGLGLILCKELVEKNGGRISVSSEPEKGSIFTFTLPKAQE